MEDLKRIEKEIESKTRELEEMKHHYGLLLHRTGYFYRKAKYRLKQIYNEKY